MHLISYPIYQIKFLIIVANDFNFFKRVCKNNKYNKYLLKEFLINLVMRDLK